jgi:hypothetical protein
MRYIQPRLIGTFAAVRTIQSNGKGQPPDEIFTTDLTNVPAYEADE